MHLAFECEDVVAVILSFLPMKSRLLNATCVNRAFHRVVYTNPFAWSGPISLYRPLQDNYRWLRSTGTALLRLACLYPTDVSQVEAAVRAGSNAIECDIDAVPVCPPERIVGVHLWQRTIDTESVDRIPKHVKRLTLHQHVYEFERLMLLHPGLETLTLDYRVPPDVFIYIRDHLKSLKHLRLTDDIAKYKSWWWQLDMEKFALNGPRLEVLEIWNRRFCNHVVSLQTHRTLRALPLRKITASLSSKYLDDAMELADVMPTLREMVIYTDHAGFVVRRGQCRIQVLCDKNVIWS